MQQKSKKSIWEFFIQHRRLAYVLLVGIVVMGFLSIVRMPKESSPEIDIPIAVVSVGFPGASAEEVEELITSPIEDRLRSLEKLDTFTSVSQEGASLITVSFDVNADSLKAMTDLRDKVDLAKIDLPGDATDPVVQQISFTDVPVVTVALTGPFEPIELKRYSEEVKREIETVTGVSKVNIIGATDREISVRVNRTALDQFELSLPQVISAINQANSNLPVGSIETAGEVYTLHFAGKIKTAEEVKAIPIATRGSAPITIGDIATVEDGLVKSDTIARLSLDGQPSTPSVTLNVFKASGGNILEVASKVKEKINESAETFPEGLIAEVVVDSADEVATDLNNLVVNGLETILIIVLLLLVFLGWREALLASIAVPLTFLMTFIVLNQMGYTLNFLTLFSLILALGILVDGAIVITEGMHANLQKGLLPKQAAIATIREFQLPLISGTLTTVFVFLPMMLTSGIIGKFIQSIPVTVTIVLISSIIVALGFITMLGSRVLKSAPAATLSSDKNSEKLPRDKKRHSIISRIYASYTDALGTFLDYSKKRKMFFWLVGILFVLSVSLPATGILQVEMFPAENLKNFTIDIENPIGTPLTQTDRDARVVESLLQDDSRITSIAINVGASSSGGSVTGGSGKHLASLTVNLNDDKDTSSIDMIAEYEKKLQGSIPGMVKVGQAANGPEQGAPINIKVKGDSLETLELIAADLADILRGIDGTRNVETSTRVSSGEFVLSIDRTKARLYGVSASEVASLLRSAITGTTATVIKNTDEDIDVVVTYNLGRDTSISEEEIELDDIRSLSITTPQGSVPLSAFMQDSLGNNRVQVGHEDGDRIVTVTSNLQKGAQSQAIVTAFQKQIKSYPLPSGYTIGFGGEAESIQQSFTDMAIAMLLGIFMIFGLLIWQFRSFRQPLFVMVTIPLALIGVLPGLTLVNQPLSFPAVIGVVALAGIVVNNAIILIDRINSNRSDGMDKKMAVHEAATSRLQPILLTTITTVAGILPLAITNPSWGPLGYSIVFGLLFSTVLTLFAVPMLYYRFGEERLDNERT